MSNNSGSFSERIYHANDSCIFRKTHEQYGGLSNMASGFTITINNVHIYSSEALYQACRFPHLPEVQEKILAPKSPMTAKMKSKPHRKYSRDDWEQNRIKIMQWCLRVKLAQNFFTFGLQLEETFNKYIVEHSDRDTFWGAKLRDDKVTYVGVNALGRLLMDLRQKYCSVGRFGLLIVDPPSISNFLLLGVEIPRLDMRESFVKNTILTQDQITQSKDVQTSKISTEIRKTDKSKNPRSKKKNGTYIDSNTDLLFRLDELD